MLTLFTIPKPFRGHVGDIQRNAIESWKALRPEVQVVLVGDEKGVQEAAQGAGVAHVSGLATNERGTPRLDSAFERVGTIANDSLWCMVNADVVLLDDFLPAIRRVASRYTRFLVVGECRDLCLPTGFRLADPGDRLQLREQALTEGRLRGYAALDYFVFPRGQFGSLPPFLVGRACFDNWLVWRVRQLGDPVVDATRSIVAVHQTHDYAHVAGGKDEAYYGEEARYNERLAGGRSHIYTLHDASHRLYRRGAPIPYPGSALRARERARAANARARLRIEAHRKRKSPWTDAQGRQLRPIRLLGVFPEPTPSWTPVLDAVDRDGGVELTVLYGAGRKENRPPTPEPAPNHTHWFPRSIRLAGAKRLLGHEYPLNWAIWNSFYGLRPDCMVVFGWSTFASQAAIIWCTARRAPYLLVVDTYDGARLRTERPTLQRALVSGLLDRAECVLVPESRQSQLLPSHRANDDLVRPLASTADDAAFQVLELVRHALSVRATVGPHLQHNEHF